MHDTTDNQNEIFDIVDLHDHVLGQATRSEVHSNKTLIHRSVYIAVFNEYGEIFLQQRSETKDKDPLFWDISVGGHVLSGDSYIESAERELFEELGLYAPVTFIKTYLARLPTETEIVALFTASSNGPFSLHPQEIKQGRFFTKVTLKQSILDGIVQLSESPRLGLSHLGWL